MSSSSPRTPYLQVLHGCLANTTAAILPCARCLRLVLTCARNGGILASSRPARGALVFEHICGSRPDDRRCKQHRRVVGNGNGGSLGVSHVGASERRKRQRRHHSYGLGYRLSRQTCVRFFFFDESRSNGPATNSTKEIDTALGISVHNTGHIADITVHMRCCATFHILCMLTSISTDGLYSIMWSATTQTFRTT